jgi:hypothetical protein
MTATALVLRASYAESAEAAAVSTAKCDFGRGSGVTLLRVKAMSGVDVPAVSGLNESRSTSLYAARGLGRLRLF